MIQFALLGGTITYQKKKKSIYFSMCLWGVWVHRGGRAGSEDSLPESFLSFYRVGPGHQTCIFVHGGNHLWLLSLLGWSRIWLFGCCCSGIYFLFVSLPPPYTWLIFGWVLCVIMWVWTQAPQRSTQRPEDNFGSWSFLPHCLRQGSCVS